MSRLQVECWQEEPVWWSIPGPGQRPPWVPEPLTPDLASWERLLTGLLSRNLLHLQQWIPSVTLTLDTYERHANYRVEFRHATRSGTASRAPSRGPSPAPAPAHARQLAPEPVASRATGIVGFIEACDEAIETAFTRLDSEAPLGDLPDNLLLPELDVDVPRAFFKAYLLYLATATGPRWEHGPLTDAEAAEWAARVPMHVWSALGFKRPPPAMMLRLVFCALPERWRVSPDLRACVSLIDALTDKRLLTRVDL